MKEEKEKEPIDFVKWFSELNKDSGSVSGGKGANLSEIYNLKIPVPPGFVVTAQAYDYFMDKAGINDEVKELLNSINYEDTKQLDEVTTKIRDHILKAKVPKEMEEEIIEAYENLDITKVDPSKRTSAHDILRNAAEPIFVAVRSSATTEDLAEASFAGQQDSYVNIKGNFQLLEHIKKCFASLFTSRATYYRNKQGFKHEQASLAVVVQKMVDSDKSGVIFSKDPAKNNDNIVMEAVFGLGEGIVSGKITPDNYIINRDLEIIHKKVADKKIAITRDSGGGKTIIKLRDEKSKSVVLSDYEIKKLADFAITLEEHFKKPQDMEFAIEGEEIFIVQTRPITTIEKRFDDSEEVKGEVILEGLAASPGIASGKIKIIDDLKDLHKIVEGDILVTKMTNPDMVVSMQKSAGIVTDDGGMTAHAAIVSREMGIPAIVGTGDATTKLKEGEVITVDGYRGKVYKGKTAETKKKEILPVTADTKTEIKVIVDLPTFAKRAALTKLKKVGLTRIEGIIAEGGKHPNYFIKQNKAKDYEDLIYKGISDIGKYFEEMWIRTSDIRTDEFSNLEGAPKEIEANPMLGFHGIRYSIKNPEILKAELKALKRVSEEGKTIGLILPQVILVEEVKKVKEFLKEIDFNDARVGVMVETPAAVQIIRDLCEEGIDFISFGTNDLTQYMLAIDRGNEEVQDLYDEMHPAILYQLGYVIRVCKRNNVETSICGQSGSRKDMAKYLVEQGIDSISVNADMAKEISDYVLEIEKGLVEGTDKEPRNYQPEEKQEESKDEKKEEKEHIEEQIEKDIEAIEKEKKEYLKEHPEEASEEPAEEPDKKEGIIEEIKEKTEELIEDKKGEAPIVPGEDTSIENNKEVNENKMEEEKPEEAEEDKQESEGESEQSEESSEENEEQTEESGESQEENTDEVNEEETSEEESEPAEEAQEESSEEQAEEAPAEEEQESEESSEEKSEEGSEEDELDKQEESKEEESKEDEQESEESSEEKPEENEESEEEKLEEAKKSLENLNEELKERIEETGEEIEEELEEEGVSEEVAEEEAEIAEDMAEDQLEVNKEEKEKESQDESSSESEESESQEDTEEEVVEEASEEESESGSEEENKEEEKPEEETEEVSDEETEEEPETESEESDKEGKEKKKDVVLDIF